MPVFGFHLTYKILVWEESKKYRKNKNKTTKQKKYSKGKHKYISLYR